MGWQPNWGNAAQGAAEGAAVAGPGGAVAGGLAGALGWNPDPNSVMQHFGTPGKNTFNATPWQNAANGGYDPNAFRGGWNQRGSAYNPNALADAANAAQGARAPGFNQAMQGQQGLAALLYGQAAGTAPSLAMQQLQQAQQTNAANTMGLMASQRGLNPGQAAINSANINAMGNQQTAAQGVSAALAERNAAQGMLGNVYSQMGGMGLQQQAQNNQLTQYYMGLGMDAMQAQLQANIAQQQMLAGSYNSAQGLNAGVAQGNANNNAALFGGLVGGIAQGGAMAMGGAAHGGIVPGYAGGGCVPGYADGGVLQPMHPGLVAALSANGGVIPGSDPGMDTVTDGRIGLRPGEVVVNQENPIYPAAKAAVQQQAGGGFDAIMAAVQQAFGLGKKDSTGRYQRNNGPNANVVGLGVGG